MEETNNVVMDEEFGVDLSDFVDETDQGGSQTDETDEQEEANDPEPEAEAAQEPEKAEKAESDDGKEDKKEEPKEPELFELKVNKGIQKVTMDQMKEYAQQGLDYGRVRQQRDSLQQNLNDQLQWRGENEETLNELAAVAQTAGMDIPTFMNSLRVNMLVQQGLSRETAQERIRAERAERQIAENRKQAKKQQETADAQEQAKKRQEEDVQNFLRTYPGVDPKSVPQSVWLEVGKGDTLVSAYGRWQNQQLQNRIKELNAKLEAQNQNKNNKQRSLGSVKSSGRDSSRDSFLDGFNE